MSGGRLTTRFGILGPLEAWRDGQPVELGGPRLRMLLALLVVNAGQVVPSASLIDGLWSESAPAGAANALQALVSRLRAALGPELVESRAGGYRLVAAADAVDGERFERLLAEGRAALAAGDPGRAAELLRAGLALWRGEPLADLGQPDALRAEIARLEALRLDATGDRIEADLVRRAHAGLVAELEALVAAHTLNERLRGLLMRALYMSGRPADALAAYERARTVLREELGVDPAPELQRLHVAVLRRDGSLDAPAAALPPTNLRAQLTSFVGRDELLERIRELLEGSRLVTLVGPGGAGKTRLAVELAERERPRYPDGVWLVELAPLSDPMDVAQAALAALGVRERGLLERGRGGVTEPLDRLLGALAGRRLLLVTDNCEHLVEETARLADAILAGCPGVHILATSREPLVVTGETLCPVPSLQLPPEDVPAADAAGYAAVRLFLDRGSATRPDLTLTPDNVAAVVQVCRRLDGLPLAIELAAARLRSLSVAQVAERLDDRFGLLTGGVRTALPRHQTLRAVVDWSWELLDDRERTLLRRLSVFAGSATLEAAEHVCAGGALAREDILDLLAGLVDKSLVEAGGVERHEMRYRLLDTVRAYGADRLSEAGEAVALGRAHARYFCDLAERAEPELRARDQLAWLARLDAAHDNLRTALRWAVASSDSSLALRLFGALAWYWSLRGLVAEGRSWLRSVMALPGEVPTLVRARAEVMAGLWSWAGESIEAATAAAERARVLYQQAGQPPHPVLLVLEPLLALLEDDMDRARALADAVLVDAGAGELAHAIGIIESGRGALDDAERALEEAAGRFRELGERAGLGQALEGLAEIAEARGDHHRALAAAEEAAGVARELGAAADIPGLLVRLGSARVLTGEVEVGVATAEEGLRLARETGIPDIVASASFAVAALARSRGDLARARELYEEAARTAPGPLAPMRAMALVGLGFLAELEGDPAHAASLHRQAVEIVRGRPFPSFWNRVVLAQAVNGLAASEAAQGNAERAAVLLGAANGLRGRAPPSAAEQADIVRADERAHRDLGAERFQRARRRGAAMSREDVLAYVDT